ncbi:DUF4367 domain-containing protein [Alkaliphilus serpentinus]|uniref:DUF4367 domain-containing protein n=1 Tax=Alkaliphilus serpentinus TaxID=1482731 RepID=A0A833HLC6_9FIRM|nr:DUF4367 domain-containing protein [Alkaliphilus serpentinus]KAB3525666.1 DUF4367 domain-containing protein [Alkaliphilus serpentinus]
MNKKVDILDSNIKEGIELELNKISVPQMEDVWENIEKEMKTNNKTFTRIKKVAIFIGVSIVLGLLIGTTDIYAQYQKVLSLIVRTMDSTINIQSQNKSNTPIDLDMEQESKTYSVTLDEALDKSSFKFMLPNVMPKGYMFAEAIINEFGKQTISLEIIYVSNKNDTINIIIEPLLGDYVESINVNSNHATYEKFKNGDLTYNIIKFKDNRILIIFDHDGVKYSVEGINEEDIFEIIQHIK